MLYTLYQTALARQGPLFRLLIRAVVPVLALLEGVRFPERRTGGWYWIWRWRFEFLMGWLERESVQACRERVRPGMTVVDAGAHIGYYTRQFAEWVGPTGRVLAIEPHPENFAILRANVARYPQVEALAVAAGGCQADLPLFVSPGHSNHSLIAGYTAAEGTVLVPVVPIDELLAARGLSPALVKSDTEGAEPLVLDGLARTLALCPEIALLLEYNPAALAAAGWQPEAFLERLRGLGFDVRILTPDGRPPATGECNLLCLRSL